MKQFATVKLTQSAAKYGDQAPLATACCNACRTCLTTNALTLALAAIAASAGMVRRLLTRT